LWHNEEVNRMKVLLIAVLVALPCLLPAENSKPTGWFKLNVLSYNIRHGAGMDGKIDLERTAEVIRKAKPDLVALQEIDKNCKRSGNVDIAAELGRLLSMEHRFGKFMDFQGGEYGMAVLSRLPIEEVIVHPLPKGAEPRCALEVQVQVAGFDQPFSFVGIHNDWTNEEIRIRQVGALMKALQPRKNPVILAGDFNGQRSDGSMKLLDQAGWLNIDKQGQKTFPSGEPRVEIDFVVVRGLEGARFNVAVIDERAASDHRPVLARMMLPLKSR
jgi:endonuclease/exonuclease/phosphatase family metal-dependent hydrolase